MVRLHPAARRVAVLLASGLLVVACSRVTAENYAKLKVGMTYQEATAILGSPAGCSDTAGFRTCKWGDDKSAITIRFAADKAVLFSSENIR